MKQEKYYEPFEFISFLDKCCDIHWIMTSLEIKLEAFKEKHPDKDVVQSEKMVDILRRTYIWLHKLEDEYSTMKRVSLDNKFVSLTLANRVKELEEENRKLNALLNNLN